MWKLQTVITKKKYHGITNTTLYDESKIRNTIMTNQKLEKSKTHQSRVSCKKISKSKKKVTNLY